MPAFVVLDAGTGGGKCAIFDERGRLLGVHKEPWSYELRVDPELPFIKEFSFSAPTFWDILCRCTRAALAKAQIAAGEVVGVAATSQREGCVFLDGHGEEIYAGPNLDARGFREGAEILERIGGARLYQITGHSAPFIFPIARYLWFRKHQTGTVAHVLMISDWLTYRLSGALAAEPSNATESMFFDLRQRCWSEELLSVFAIPPEVLPPVRQSGERIGALTSAAATATGLAAGTPVFLGGADTQCSLLGAGAINPRQTAATLGTTTPVQTVMSEATFDPQSNLWAGCHVVPHRWVLESNAGDTGDAYLWLLDLVSGGLPRDDRYRVGEQLAAGRFGPPTMMFVGPTVFDLLNMNPSRPGGILFPFPSMHVRPDRGVLVRAFLESIGFAVRANLEQLVTLATDAATELFVSGGLSRSAVLTQILADVAGIPVHVSEEAESAALGCAILIAANTNCDGLPGAVESMVRHRKVAPDSEQHERYEAPFAKWRELYNQLGDTYLT